MDSEKNCRSSSLWVSANSLLQRLLSGLLGDRPSPGWCYWLAVLVLCVIQGILMWRITEQVNHDPNDYDQGSYLLMVEKLKGSGFPWYSDGVRNPLMPWLASFVVEPKSPESLLRAQRFNGFLGMAGTLLLAGFFRRSMGPLAAWNASALSALALLLPASTFFGAETLFFPLFFFSFVLCAGLLVRNPLVRSLALGVLVGLAALAKASVAPLLALFFFWGGVRALGGRRWPHWFAAPDRWSTREFLVGGILVVLLFLGLQGPRMFHAHQTWGNPTYSLPSYWFWADSWEQCVAHYTDCRQTNLENMPAHLQPTLPGYFLRNTPTDALHRLTTGLLERTRQFFLPEKKFRIPFDKRGKPKSVVLPHRGFYIIALWFCAGILVGMFVFRVRQAGGNVELPHSFGLLACFFSSVCFLYACAMAWYLPIGPGHRFILTLFLPVLWTGVLVAESMRQRLARPAANGIFLLTHLVMAGFLVARINFLLADGKFENVGYTF
jgi:hypothetical protein